MSHRAKSPEKSKSKYSTPIGSEAKKRQKQSDPGDWSPVTHFSSHSHKKKSSAKTKTSKERTRARDQLLDPADPFPSFNFLEDKQEEEEEITIIQEAEGEEIEQQVNTPEDLEEARQDIALQQVEALLGDRFREDKTPKFKMADPSLKPTPFSGDKTGQTPSTFLTKFLAYTDLNKITDEKSKIMHFHLLLTGSAATWFELVTDNEKESWEGVETAFKKRYITGNAFATETEFFERKQRKEETVAHYCDDVLRMGIMLGRSPPEIRSKIIQGLRPTHRRFVLSTGKTDLADLVEQAKLAETLCAAERGEDLTQSFSALNMMSGTSQNPHRANNERRQVCFDDKDLPRDRYTTANQSRWDRNLIPRNQEGRNNNPNEGRYGPPRQMYQGDRQGYNNRYTNAYGSPAGRLGRGGYNNGGGRGAGNFYQGGPNRGDYGGGRHEPNFQRGQTVHCPRCAHHGTPVNGCPGPSRWHLPPNNQSFGFAI